ncbi:MAG: hypothetical protein OEX02_18705 [Cyclobacteriaceae bacterium]|nr:hypothetical protein [Cyclobacteriaceae bacterium]
MNEDKTIEQLSALITKDFSLEQSEVPVLTHSYDALRTHVIRVVKNMLDHNFSLLLTALYRIDVSEQKVKETLAVADPSKMAEILADLILEREMAKVLTRQKYK